MVAQGHLMASGILFIDFILLFSIFLQDAPSYCTLILAA
jgi:hypothetical protein